MEHCSNCCFTSFGLATHSMVYQNFNWSQTTVILITHCFCDLFGNANAVNSVKSRSVLCRKRTTFAAPRIGLSIAYIACRGHPYIESCAGMDYYTLYIFNGYTLCKFTLSYTGYMYNTLYNITTSEYITSIMCITSLHVNIRLL